MAKTLNPVAFPSIEKPYAEQPPPPWSSNTGRMEGQGGPLQKAQLTVAFTEGPLLYFHLSPCPVFPPLHLPTSVKLSQFNSASPFLQSFHKSLLTFQLPCLPLLTPVTHQYSAAALGQDGLEFTLILLPDPSVHWVTDLTAVSLSLLILNRQSM